MALLHSGEKLDHYQIENIVASSGMATIYRGTDLRSGRQVAIKIPHFEMESDPVLFDRFHREGEIAKTLDHPGVVKVLIDSERSSLYMVMEWAEGQLLRHVLNEKKKLLSIAPRELPSASVMPWITFMARGWYTAI